MRIHSAIVISSNRCYESLQGKINKNNSRKLEDVKDNCEEATTLGRYTNIRHGNKVI